LLPHEAATFPSKRSLRYESGWRCWTTAAAASSSLVRRWLSPGRRKKETTCFMELVGALWPATIELVPLLLLVHSILRVERRRDLQPDGRHHHSRHLPTDGAGATQRQPAKSAFPRLKARNMSRSLHNSLHCCARAAPSVSLHSISASRLPHPDTSSSRLSWPHFGPRKSSSRGKNVIKELAEVREGGIRRAAPAPRPHYGSMAGQWQH
jgi:hypothetical protein